MQIVRGVNAVVLRPPWTGSPSLGDLLPDEAHTLWSVTRRADEWLACLEIPWSTVGGKPRAFFGVHAQIPVPAHLEIRQSTASPGRPQESAQRRIPYE